MRRRGAAVAAVLVAAVLALTTACSSTGIHDTSQEPAIDPTAPVVAFYGDSYTLGTGATQPALRWSSIICANRGWTEVNPSVNGLGFINNRRAFGDGDLPSSVIDSGADIVFITMGLNDNFSFDFAADRIEAQIGDDFDRIGAGLPDARVIVVEPFWYTDERPPSVEVIIGWVRDAAQSRGWEYISGASRWIEGHPEWMASDGLHPNDDGYARMAELMGEELAELGL